MFSQQAAGIVPYYILPQAGISSISSTTPDEQGNYYLVYISDLRRITLAQIRNDPPRAIYSRQVTTNGASIIYINPTIAVHQDKIYLLSTKSQTGSTTVLVLFVLNFDGTIARQEQRLMIPNQGTNSISGGLLTKDDNGNLYVMYQMSAGSSENIYTAKIERTTGAIMWSTFIDTSVSSINEIIADTLQNKLFLTWTINERINNRDTTNVFFGSVDATTGQASPNIRITNSEWYHTRPDLVLNNEGLDLIYIGGRENNNGYHIYDHHLNFDGSIEGALLTNFGDSPFEVAALKKQNALTVFFTDGSLGHRSLRRTYYRPVLEMVNPRRGTTTPIALYASRQKNQNAFVALSFGTENNWLAFDALFFISWVLFPNGQIIHLNGQGQGTASLWLPGTTPIVPFYAGFATYTSQITAFSDVLQRQSQP